MSRVCACLRAASALVVLEWMAASAAAHVAAETEPPPRQETAAEKIRRALEQPVSLDLSAKESPLHQLLVFLREKIKVPVSLDHAECARTLQAARGNPLDSPDIPVHFEKTKLRTVLRSVLRPYNLTSVIADNSLVITTPEVAPQRQLRQTVSVDVSEASLRSSLRQLTRMTAVNIVLDPRVPSDNLNSVTLSIEDVPLETAAKLVAELAGLKTVAVGNVIFVTTEVRANKLRAEFTGAPVGGGNVLLPMPRPLLPPVQTPDPRKKPPEP